MAGTGIAAQVTDNVRMLLAEHLDVVYADLDLEATTDPDSAVQALRHQGFSYAACGSTAPATTITFASSASTAPIDSTRSAPPRQVGTSSSLRARGPEHLGRYERFVKS